MTSSTPLGEKPGASLTKTGEDVFTALPYAKGRRYFDAVALIIFTELVAESSFCITFAKRVKGLTIRYGTGKADTDVS